MSYLKLIPVMVTSVIVTSLFLGSCNNSGASIDQVKNISSQARWSAEAKSTPILSAGDERNNSFWNDPHVLKVGDEYVMYMTTSVNEAFKPPVLPFRAVSKDGINWRLSPQTPLLSAKETPFVNNETPSVVFYKGQYHMYYTGVYPDGQVPAMAVGHAVSKDGISWVNDNKPILEATGNHLDWNGYLVAEPGAVVFNGKIYLYYAAAGSRVPGPPPQFQSIGLVTSSYGRTFDQQRQVLTQSATYPAEKGFVGYSTPAAVAYKGRIHLVYDVAAYGEHNDPQWQQVAIHHAVSGDGMTNFKQDKLPIFTRKDFSWTSGEIIGPSILISDGKLKLWFAGHVSYSELAAFVRNGMKGPEIGIGYAEIRLEEFLK